ncbi:MAG: hypothetical protein M1835_006267 [Candelina submexicana]|nr:MAG: hypothetical protein M1835_006267 [Candelina submexicana]
MAKLHEDSEDDFPELAQLMQQPTTSRHRPQSSALAVGTEKKEKLRQIRQYRDAACQIKREITAYGDENDKVKEKRHQKLLETYSDNLPSRPQSSNAAKAWRTPLKSKDARASYRSLHGLEADYPITSRIGEGEGSLWISQKRVVSGQQKSRTKSPSAWQSDSMETKSLDSDGKENAEDEILMCLENDELGFRISNTSSCEDDDPTLLVLSTPTAISPCKTSMKSPFAKTPSSPSHSTRRTPALGTPSKQLRIPPSPHRPSIDDFWSQAVINRWSDQYSPRKGTSSRHIQEMPGVASQDEDSCPSIRFPRNQAPRSPSKKDSKASEAKKAFNLQKHDLAKNFLKELDDTVTGGKVASMAASAGGIHIIWSKKLNSTAGRANWKREHSKTMDEDHLTAQGETLPISHRHIASIELAEKVIDNKERLINVIAHEYCHLANFMISEVRNNPHGKEYKRWAKKCSNAFRHRGVEVTTKHSYTIDYRYIWECTKCKTTFKRHSKSIDPLRHTCGACKAELVQTQPTPRTKGPSDYQLFVKEHFRKMKQTNPGVPHKDIMSLLGTAYKHQKTTSGRPVLLENRSITNTSCHDDSKVIGDFELVDDEVDDVARTLDFLDLGDS